MSQTLEQRLLHILTNPQPLPRYELWQKVRYGQCNRECQIVGYYWESIDASIHNDVYPGWWYVIEGSAGHVYHVFEEAITPVEVSQ